MLLANQVDENLALPMISICNHSSVAEGERKLYLAIESTAELSVQKAKVTNIPTYTPPLNQKLMLPKVPFASFWILIY